MSKKHASFAQHGRNPRALFSRKTDGWFDILRKLLFSVAAITFVVTLSLLIYESVVIPAAYTSEIETVREIYRPQTTTPDSLAKDEESEPLRIDDLRAVNSDTVGGLSFASTDADVGLSIDYPVLQTNNNEYYLNHTFYKKKNKTGSLFLDCNNQLAPERDKSLIIYGHNLSTGLMFSGLNKLVNNLYAARTATSFTFTTEKGTDTYLVFGVMISNADAAQGPVFNYMRRNFASAEEFAAYVEELRRRSMYDYSVEVDETDELLLLSTCSPRRETQYKGSRTVIMARKLRAGETQTTPTLSTNHDCLFPLVYYVSKNLPIPNEYTKSSSATTAKTNETTGTKPSLLEGE